MHWVGERLGRILISVENMSTLCCIQAYGRVQWASPQSEARAPPALLSSVKCWKRGLVYARWAWHLWALRPMLAVRMLGRTIRSLKKLLAYFRVYGSHAIISCMAECNIRGLAISFTHLKPTTNTT